MSDLKTCPQCGKNTDTSLACSFCGYRFHTDEGELEIGLAGSTRKPLRLNLQAWLAAGGAIALSMCLCPQPWLYVGKILDTALGIPAGFWSLSNAAAAALIACPVLYAAGALVTLLVIWRKRR